MSGPLAQRPGRGRAHDPPDTDPPELSDACGAWAGGCRLGSELAEPESVLLELESPLLELEPEPADPEPELPELLSELLDPWSVWAAAGGGEAFRSTGAGFGALRGAAVFALSECPGCALAATFAATPVSATAPAMVHQVSLLMRRSPASRARDAPDVAALRSCVKAG
jgi:hypothetical protein